MIQVGAFFCWKKRIPSLQINPPHQHATLSPTPMSWGHKKSQPGTPKAEKTWIQNRPKTHEATTTCKTGPTTPRNATKQRISGKLGRKSRRRGACRVDSFKQRLEMMRDCDLPSSWKQGGPPMIVRYKWTGTLIPKKLGLKKNSYPFRTQFITGSGAHLVGLEGSSWGLW